MVKKLLMHSSPNIRGLYENGAMVMSFYNLQGLHVQQVQPSSIYNW